VELPARLCEEVARLGPVCVSGPFARQTGLAGLDDVEFLCYIKSVRIEWDPQKAKPNEQKHGVSFEEAATCFDDPNGCYFRNESPSYEDRLILIAMSSRTRLLFVVHAEVGRDSIRIVSARKASPAQRRIYDGLD
jgi:uncharacterized DUF497 family protein